MPISKSEFLETTRKSRVLSDQQLRPWIDSTEPDGTRIASQMVREKVLTEWQAKYLLTGRHQLDIGPYRLLERTQRDELGDRFSAVHLQLGRNVDLQMLSAAMSKNQTQYQAFIERVGQTSKLDHPNLSHVYDVDKAGGRYYLVTEHVNGNRFSEMKSNGLDLTSVAEWLSQAISGMRLVHANALVHGDLRLEDFVVDHEHGIKILNLAVTELRLPLDAKSIASRIALDDWRTLGKIFQDFSKQVPASHSSASQSEWLALIHELTQCSEVGKIDEIEKRLADVRASLGATTDKVVRLDQIDDLGMEADGENEFSTTTPSSRNRVQASSSKTESKSGLPASSMSQHRSDQEELDGESDFEESFFARLAIGNPIGLLSSAFVVGLMLAGSLTYLILGMDSGRSVAQVVAKNEVPLQKKLVPTSLKQENQESKDRSAGSLDQIDPQAFIKKLDPIESNDSAPAPPVSQPTPAVVSDSQAVVSPTPSASPMVETQTAQPVQTNQAGGVTAQTAPVEPVPTPPSQGQAPSNQSPQTQSSAAPVAGAISPEEMQKRTENPFGQLPKQVSLPSPEDLVEVKLGEVFVADRFLLGAELVVNPTASSQKVHFETVRDATNNQRWMINFSRTPKDKKSPIATIRREGQEVFFKWLPEAKEVRQSGWLQNCLLKLFIPEKSILLPLRKPVEIAPLVLEAEKLTAESVFEIDYLPKPEALLVEVLPVNIDKTRLQPSVIDLNGIPGRILLKDEDNSAIVWVNLGLDLKAKSKLRADLVVTDGVRMKPLKNLKELQAMAATWKQQEMVLVQQIGVAEATPAPHGKGEEKDQFIAELKRQKNLATDNAVKLQGYVELAPKMMGQPYGIRIVARYDGVEVELANTVVSGK